MYQRSVEVGHGLRLSASRLWRREVKPALWALGLIVIIAGLCVVEVGAQATEGTILGTITDSSGGAVPGATISVTSVQTNAVRTTLTNDVGEFVVTNLPLGSYTVSAEMTGFKKAVHPPVEITVKARVRVNLQLEVGEMSQSVEVAATAPLIKTDTVEVSTVVRRDQLQELPVLSRNFLNLSILTPGTVRITEQNRSGVVEGRPAEFSGDSVGVGSQLANQNNFIIDGISNNMEFSGAMGVVPAIDAIQEFSVQTSGYSAEFGKAGGGIINVAIRSGTNELHGFAYDYIRNDALNARPYDFTHTNVAKQPLRRNQFGGGLSGPIIKDKIFLFGNYEGVRQPSSSVGYFRVGTPAEKQGDFSQSGFNIYDPLTQHPDPNDPNRIIRDQFPGNKIPAERINPAMTQLLKYFPDPNFTDPNPSILKNYQKVLKNSDRLDSMNLKGDIRLKESDTVTIRYSEQWVDREREGFMPNDVIGGHGDLDGTNAGILETHIFSPALINEFRAGWNYLRFGNLVANEEIFTDNLGIPGVNVQPSFPNINMRNLERSRPVRTIASIPSPFLLVQNSFQFMDNVSWQKDRHAIKFGGEVSWHRNDTWAPAPGGVEFNYDANITTPYVGAKREAIRTGMPDALLGLASEFTTYYTNDETRIRVRRMAGFIQDDWRTTSKLSLSLGVRYELLPYWGEDKDRLTNFDVTRQKILVPESTRSYLEQKGLANGDLPTNFLYVPLEDVIPKTDYLNFGPRVGFAYSLLENKLVLRGGYGMYFAGYDANYNNNTAGSPFTVRVRYYGTPSDGIPIEQGFPSGSYAAVLAAPYPEISQWIERDHPDHYTHKYNLNIQVSPLKNTAIDIGYNGSRAVAFPLGYRFNYPPPGPGDMQPRRPYPNFADGFALFHIGDSWYDALEITVKQRELHGLSLDSTFTWSKNLGYQSIDPYNLSYGYGLANYDYGKRWVTAFIYRVPTPADIPMIARQFLGGWQASGIVNLQGGFPFSVYAGNEMNDDLDASRANLVGNPVLPGSQRTIDRWFDTDAFEDPPNYVWGNSGINILRAPGFAQVDFSLSKAFTVTEGKRISVRMEASNLFNRVNLGRPSSTIGSSGFGTIRSLAGDPRNIQMALRFDF
ncbi:MAG: carboxypeptidase regulatory-like domain-containing protein [Acidobacteriota bacterium]